MQELHAGVMGGHVGERKTVQQLKHRFYWPGYSLDVKKWCQTCATCASHKTTAPKNCAPLQTIQAGTPMQAIAVDIMDPLPKSSNKNSYILNFADYFTHGWKRMRSMIRKQPQLHRSLFIMYFADWESLNSCTLTRGSSLKVSSFKNCATF